MSTNLTHRLGAHVLYCLDANDVRSIISRRREAGRAALSGNDPHEGDFYPAVIVRDWADPRIESGELKIERPVDDIDGVRQPNRALTPDEALRGVSVNLQVHLDGTDTYWATSRTEYLTNANDHRGTWCYAEDACD